MPKKTNRRKVNWGEINQQIAEGSKKNYQRNDGYSEHEFKPLIKEDGTHESIIRLLPRKESDVDQIPYVKLYSHGFKGLGGQWFIENCPTTLDGECPVCKENTIAWNAGDQDTARNRARKQSFYCNVLVVKDPQTPENNGKVFVFRFGKKVMEKVMAKLSPAGEIDDPVQVFDYDEGMNFKLKITTGNYRNYDGSEFTGTVTSVGDDDFINKIDEQLHSLDPIVAPDKFKDFDTLKETFDKKMGRPVENTPAPVAEEDTSSDSDDTSEDSEEDIFDALRNEAATE